MKSSLQQKAITGVLWNLAERFGVQGIQLVLGILLARLLTPSDFGLIGMITAFFVVAEVFVQSGLGSAYVQKKEVTAQDADTVFYVNLGISVVIYGCLWMAAPTIADFYRQPILINLTRIMGLVVVINAFNVIQMAQLTRSVDFKRKTMVTLIASLVSGVAGVAAALFGFGVWSLVLQQMSNRLLTTLGLWGTSSWSPGLGFSRESFRNLFSFGVWLLASSIVRTLFDNVYILTIGKFFSAAQLGFYTKAKQFQAIPSVQISGAIGAVAFPILSTFQNDKVNLKQSMKKFLTHTMFITAPLLITLIVVAKSFVVLILTEKWAPMIPYMQLLCIAGFLYPIHQVNVQVLQAQGKSALNFRLALIKNFMRIFNIIFMHRFGVIFIIFGEIIVSFLGLAINTYYSKHLVGYGLKDQIEDLKYIIFSSIIITIVGLIIVNSISNIFFEFIFGLFFPISVYFYFHFIFNKLFLLNFINLKKYVYSNC